MVLVDSKYFPNIVSRTASFVDRASPEEKAILARVVSTLSLCHNVRNFALHRTVLGVGPLPRLFQF